MFEPVEILNGLTKGVILVVYDFVRFTVLGFLLPFVRRSHKIWPTLFAADRRLSSLAHLLIWIFGVVTLFSGNVSNVALSAAGLSKNSDVQALATMSPDAQVPAIVATVLLITMVVDIAVRACAAAVRLRVRRDVFEPLARIAAANIFLGIFIVLTAAQIDVYRNPNMFSFLSGPFFTLFGLATFAGFSAAHLYLPLFGISLAIVALKAFAIKRLNLKLFISLAVVLIAPLLFVEATFCSYIGVASLARVLSPPRQPSLAQQFGHCTYAAGHVRASGLLKLEDAPTLALTPHDFTILPGYVPPDPTAFPPAPATATSESSGQGSQSDVSSSMQLPPGYFGRGDEGQPPIILQSGRFTSVTIVAPFTPLAGGPAAPQGDFECELRFLGDLFDHSKPVTEPPLISVPTE